MSERPMSFSQAVGASGHVVYDCQWPGCRRLAEHRAARGTTRHATTPMVYMLVCTPHLLAFRKLPDIAARDISAHRQPARRRIVSRGYARLP